MSSYNLTHLAQLEHEAVFIMREVAAQFERPALLFSGGKDSIVMVRLAQKAFWPAKFPFPLVHIDTGHNFDETIAFRDELVRQTGARLIVRYVEDTIKAGRAADEKGPNPSRNALQTVTLLDTIAEHKFDACLGGARRDEEKARA
ncbi:MAG TPA: sulfate adenylyltransferase subunit CysD, partial [Opitutaceae bacterium]|nr:sulfate adenylyltransferase subunit CysD [Opitutaceae bacterium]